MQLSQRTGDDIRVDHGTAGLGLNEGEVNRRLQYQSISRVLLHMYIHRTDRELFLEYSFG